MTVRQLSSRMVGKMGAMLIAFVALAYFGVQYMLTQGWGLVFEVAYILVLLIVFAIVADRLFIR
ncbi:hypothetical protein [Halalkalicoccus tibetensis]|uniref:Uncharacterized protein n=1 Tax=Halalkalicoccus tibetensis TaxID=175632 RepID=A0ABD5VAK0_9EURY